MPRTVRVTVGSLATSLSRTVTDLLGLVDNAFRPGFGLGIAALGTSPLGG